MFKAATPSFDELLEKDITFRIHQRNIQKLAIEMFKHKIAPKLMCELFQVTEYSYDLRNDYKFRTYNIKTVQYWTGTLFYGT